ncbi:PWWP domain-containing DNA repair factor 3A-like isoform X1 [Erpetoichthys calabaricus]|uniref:PWWP domain-containing DNA repair factor 3A-like isoform X1 n=1 Tax=Erpetoichthys calabaricus TaxID=27687 RepID=UPI0022345FF1|nr:PWWP domain-containing DNA repair factor 3A-like isoform X1 [Erpetoichthys calabaricus]
MTYIEDEELIDCLYNFLDEVLSRAVGTFDRIDRVRIILDVLMPEALIKAIQTDERISLPEAENLFMDGPVYMRGKSLTYLFCNSWKHKESTTEAFKLGITSQPYSNKCVSFFTSLLPFLFRCVKMTVHNRVVYI